MTAENAKKITYQTAELNGKSVLFTESRVKHNSIPAGLYLYEIRHSDEDWGEPCELAKNVFVNYYGSIITNEPLQLSAYGFMEINSDDLWFTDEPYNTLEKYAEQFPPIEVDLMEMKLIQPDERNLLFSMSDTCDKANGCVGHLRGDFGSGYEFYTTWWPHQDDVLNTRAFKYDLDRVVNWLREELAPLHDFGSMSRYCSFRGQSAQVPEASLPSYGFAISTKKYRFMLRCTPVKGDYNFYIYCYERKALERALSTPKKEKGEAR